MVKPENLSKQKLQELVWKGMNRCPKCGGTPSVRSLKGKLCEYHVELKAAAMRKRLGYGRHIPMSVYEKADWSLGRKELSKKFGVKIEAIEYAYKKLVRLQRIKPIKGFLRGRDEFFMELKRKAAARREERERLQPKKKKLDCARRVDPERIAWLLPLLLRKRQGERVLPIVERR